MANYRAEIIKSETGYFEFEADNDDLAHDHIQMLIDDYKDREEKFFEYYINRGGPTYLGYTKLETWREV